MPAAALITALRAFGFEVDGAGARAVHGGNWGADANGTPYLFDPAAYFGDREADLAMTRLFGGFGTAFYRAYDDAWPPAPGRDRRIDLYNLYHLLNHFNLFGGGYRSQVLACAERLLQS